jgi:hypothetical protein
MSRRALVLLLAVSLAGLLVAGCGGGGNSKQGSKPSTADAKTDTTAKADAKKTKQKKATPPANESAAARDKRLKRDAGKPIPLKPKQVRQKLVSKCEQGVRKRNPKANKQRVAELCDKAAPPADTGGGGGSGDKQAKRQLDKETCLAEAENSGLSGAAKQLARKQCESVAP